MMVTIYLTVNGSSVEKEIEERTLLVQLLNTVRIWPRC